MESYLDSFVNYEVLPGFGFAEANYDLSHVRELLRRLGDPQTGPLTVHIAGSKGKGSVAAMVAAALTACGVRTGLYTSPHIIHIGERIQIDGIAATPWELSEALDAVKPHLERMSAEGCWRRPTYFEILTALAFVHFRVSCVEAQVIEVGLGGRLDATNVVQPDVCVITPVSLEHTTVLGDTVGKIAREKAGIIKPGAAVVTAPQATPAMEVIGERCRLAGTPLVQIGRDVHFTVVKSSLHGQSVALEDPSGQRSFRIPLAGDYQAENAATAVGVLRLLKDKGLPLEDDCIQAGLQSVWWPGRFEVLAERPLLLLDGAHNPASMRRLAHSLNSLGVPRPLVFVLGFSADKDIVATVSELVGCGGRLVITESSQPRAASPADIARMLTGLGVEYICEPRPSVALVRAAHLAGTDGTVCVAGSLYLVADVLRMWQDDKRHSASQDALPP
ncbi:MAG: bifunctional folylpolyglutamate synthase/dihydrofolate synthase, partial [Chloroflexota bacterium]